MAVIWPPTHKTQESLDKSPPAAKNSVLPALFLHLFSWLYILCCTILLQDAAEFAKTHSGLRMHPNKKPGKTFSPSPLTVLPPTVDWRTKGFVTGVKNEVREEII